MKVEIWSDVVCPFCYIGKRKFENALVDFKGEKDVEVIWHSFQLDPDLVAVPGQTIDEWLGIRKGTSTADGKRMNDAMTATALEVGLVYNLDKAVVTNTLDAHRLLHLAKKHGVQNEMKERLFQAYYTESEDIGNWEILIRLALEIGIDTAETRAMLDSDLYTDEVHQDQEHARQIGVQGVPFYVFDNKYAVSGAQPTELFREVLDKIYEEHKPLIPVSGTGDFCAPGGDC